MLPATVERGQILAESAFISVTKPGSSSGLGVNGSIVKFSAGKETSTPVVDVEDLQQRISASVGAQPQQFFVIKADQEVPYETFDMIMDSLREANAQNVTFLSKRK